MKKYLVIGNPINHSLSPKLHNYWLKIHKINAIYEKKKLNEVDLKHLILQIQEGKISGANVTVPFKNKIIPFLDELSAGAKNTHSVNTIYLSDNKIIGHNTDIDGFESSIKVAKHYVKNKKALILGSGGVVPSIIFALHKMDASEIIVTNRTKNKAENLKKLFKNISIVNWGVVPDVDIIINATSLGLNKDDNFDLNFANIGKNKLFYDLIYNPSQTNFLKLGEKLGNKTENGKMMFVYQAQKSFEKWHKVLPEANKEVMDLLDD